MNLTEARQKSPKMTKRNKEEVIKDHIFFVNRPLKICTTLIE